MKKLLTVIICVLAGSVNAQVQFSQEEFLKIVKGEKNAHAGKLMPTTQVATSEYDVKYYNCFWNIDPAINYISGNVTTLFTPVQSSFDSIVLDLSSALTVDSVIYHNSLISFNHSNEQVSVALPAPIPAGTLDSVTVYYQGVPPVTGFGSFIQDQHNGTPVIWTLSEPYGSSDWWPCKNGLTDKADSADITITTPSAYSAASNGLLKNVIPNGATTTYHWEHRYPIATYLICLAVTNYSKYSHYVPYNGDTLEVVNYIYPEDSLNASLQTGEIVQMIQLYDTLFGEYPFQNEKYGHAQFNWGGGMEHQTMTFITGFGFDLLAHELGHHWFGDKVTCGSWADIWLNEGFATYLSGLCYEHLQPSYWMLFKQNEINYITSQPNGSVYCTDTTDLNRLFDGRLTYVKGAMILHQLRWVIGDSAFYAGINNYLSDVTCAYEFARTSDLKAHLEASSGQNLTWYFNDWFTGEGFPSYQMNWSQTGSTVYLQVNQTQSDPSVPYFELPLPVKFKNSAQDTIIRIDNTFSGQNYVLNVPFAVDSVIFDPDWWIISNSNVVATGLTNNVNQPDFTVEPNLTSTKISVKNISFANFPVSVSITDVTGKLVLSRAVSEKNCDIDVSELNKGFYFVKISADNSFAVKRFLKQ